MHPDEETEPNGARLAITGLGVVSGFGVGKDLFAAGLRAGRSCARTIEAFDTAGFRSKQGCLVGPIRPAPPDPLVARLPSGVQFGIMAAEEAIRDAGLGTSPPSRDRVGVFFAASCNTQQTEEYHRRILDNGPGSASPLLFQNTTYMAGPGTLSIKEKLTGPVLAMPGGHSAGLQALDAAAMYLSIGTIDAAVVVGADELTPIHYEAMYRLGLLTPQTGGSAEVCRPFDLRRDGMMLGEGAGAVVLERWPEARERRIHVHAELAATATAHDAYRVTDVAPDGRGLAHAMRLALTQAGDNPQRIQYIAATANGTRIFDTAEVKAVASVFGEHASTVAISSIKSMVGETSAAGGILNVIACVVAIQESFLPPTINFADLDPECAVDCVPNVAREGRVEAALATAYSFGGSSGCALVKSCGSA